MNGSSGLVTQRSKLSWFFGPVCLLPGHTRGAALELSPWSGFGLGLDLDWSGKGWVESGQHGLVGFGLDCAFCPNVLPAQPHRELGLDLVELLFLGFVVLVCFRPCHRRSIWFLGTQVVVEHLVFPGL